MKPHADDITNLIAAAFRSVEHDRDFRANTENADLTIIFEITEPKISGVVSILNGRIFWNTTTPESPDLHLSWRSWDALREWTESWAPLWWYRLTRRLRIDGEQNPVLQECLYLFRNYLQLLLKNS
ncbi:MAG: hypothetical protein K9N46_01165 [Candidatus Marinimicrobia bacterium]|nr:hypothetical protein [Candidatus Neomarinimicrobiota bacterium]MCF7827914.1 hypothetical protein [Candidatus Neomarinimicrobiota bacterium]MCF7879331.1 hypothetical protein [Candidatus Neomarinimicrobiota bacterium]